ncbi:MAG: DUF721 domain-containing protein [Alphaproteobacteria bacterium]
MANHNFPPKGLQSAGKVSSFLTRTLISKKENFLASILYDWPIIVGQKYASQLKPEKVIFPKNKNTGASLHLSVSNGSVALMAHHLQPFILSKVNQFIGYQAFDKITLQQTKNPSSLSAPHTYPNSPASLTLAQEEELKNLLKETPDGDLKEALENLGKSLFTQKENPS